MLKTQKSEISKKFTESEHEVQFTSQNQEINEIHQHPETAEIMGNIQITKDDHIWTTLEIFRAENNQHMILIYCFEQTITPEKTIDGDLKIEPDKKQERERDLQRVELSCGRPQDDWSCLVCKFCCDIMRKYVAHGLNNISLFVFVRPFFLFSFFFFWVVLGFDGQF